MKRFFSNFLFGLCLGAGVSISIITWTLMNTNTPKNSNTSIEIDPSSAKIEIINLDTTDAYPKIRVIIQNGLNKEVYRIRGHIDFYDSEGLFGNCWENFGIFNAHEKKEVEINCWNITSDKLPNNTSVRARVPYASTKIKS